MGEDDQYPLKKRWDREMFFFSKGRESVTP